VCSDSSAEFRSPYLKYIYDCGAIGSYAKSREIRHCRNEMRDGVLDLLFLSHMHADHVNGIPKLLERRGRGPTVHTIVMPLVDDIERLVAFAAALDRDASSADDDFYTAFVLDAVGELARRFSPRQIILVGAGNRAPEGGAPDFGFPSTSIRR
jgi:ribonuclease BN (tRNA processing enzyme)